MNDRLQVRLLISRPLCCKLAAPPLLARLGPPLETQGDAALKAPPFAYVKAESIEQVFDLLLQYGDRARILAGGQSLLAALNRRLSAPDLLIDITALPGMGDIALQDGTVRIGALVTHAELERSAVISRHLPLLAQAVPHVGHVAIRNVGTFGG